MRKHSVYFLAGASCIFYVGITNCPRRRMNEHRKKVRDGNRNMTYTKWRKEEALGGEVRMIICASDVEKEEAQELEKALIKFYGRRDIKTGILTNHSDGGESSKGFVVTESFRDAVRSRMIGSKINCGRKRPDMVERFSKPVCAIVIDTGEEITYPSQRVAAKALGIHYDTVYRKVNKITKSEKVNTKLGIVSLKFKEGEGK